MPCMIRFCNTSINYSLQTNINNQKYANEITKTSYLISKQSTKQIKNNNYLLIHAKVKPLLISNS